MKTYEQARLSAEALCVKSEHCVFDIRRKCFVWGLGKEETQALIAYLKAERFIDHARYASAYVREKSRLSKWGRKKIEMGLRAKMIEGNVIVRALEEMPEEAETKETLRKLVVQKDKSLKESDARKRKEKLLRFALSRGYDVEDAMEAVSSVICS